MEPSGSRVDTASVIVAATPEQVFHAFSDPEALVAWLPPGNMKGRILAYDFREGGRYRIELTYAEDVPAGVGKTTGRTDISRGCFLQIVPGKRIVQTVEFESEDASFAGEMQLSWSFEAQFGATRVTIVATNVPPGITKADHDAGFVPRSKISPNTCNVEVSALNEAGSPRSRLTAAFAQRPLSPSLPSRLSTVESRRTGGSLD